MAGEGSRETTQKTREKTREKIISLIHKNPNLTIAELAALTGDSLQSADQLFKVATALGLDVNALGLDKKLLRPIFEARNQIIHELDIDLEGERRTRILRGLDEMIEWTNRVLDLTKRMIETVDKMIPPMNKRINRRIFLRR